VTAVLCAQYTCACDLISWRVARHQSVVMAVPAVCHVVTLEHVHALTIYAPSKHP
jgi:hypothetical protein